MTPVSLLILLYVARMQSTNKSVFFVFFFIILRFILMDYVSR